MGINNILSFPFFTVMLGRKQRVKLTSEYSSYVNIDRGIPQESILGKVNFITLLSGLLLDFKTTEICNFADDNSKKFDLMVGGN